MTRMITVDGNEAAASVAHRINEVIAIYPITPSTPMGELSDAWSVQNRTNIWGTVPDVMEMQSEGGASGAVHGALQGGALTTTFTASQGLLLMIPNLYKIAGELTSTCIHVAARTVATHALSIFGDHSDVMACRQTGLGMLCSGSVQEVHDFACIAQAASLHSRIPFMHFFDGFRTSHEIAKIEELSDDHLRHMIDEDSVFQHRSRALTPDNPVLRGTAQNPDAFFQAREAINRFYLACPQIVQDAMDRFASRTRRQYRLFDYEGHPEAERIIVMMGSGAETAHEAVEWLTDRGEKVGLVKVRLFRPFSIKHLLDVIPSTVKGIAVLDRTKEPGSIGEPLYQDVVTALSEGRDANIARLFNRPRIIGGRYGLSSKEFTPAMVKAVFDELEDRNPKAHFTVGINDDVTHTSLTVNPGLETEGDGVVRSVFFGLGSDGTVGANKNSIKIIGDTTTQMAQGYFVYDSKKAGAITISHLRFGPKQIRSSYLIRQANFVACHQFNFLEKYDVLGYCAPGATFLVNAPFPTEEVWNRFPQEVQEEILAKDLKVYAIDASKVAAETGMGGRINTIMQTCFFAISGVLERDTAIAKIKEAIQKTYSKSGQEVVVKNFAAVDAALAHLHQLPPASAVTSKFRKPPVVPAEAPDFVRNLTATIIAQKGDLLPVSAFPVDGTWPMGTSKWEKRTIADSIPVWEEDICIQCNHCTFFCPHAAIRAKVYPADDLRHAPDGFTSLEANLKGFKDSRYTISVAPDDCTGCHLCVEVCPVTDKTDPTRKAINMTPLRPILEKERVAFDFFLGLPEIDRTAIPRLDVKGTQLMEPLFEYSGACQGCGETPYIKLVTQLFGDRTVIANATGCSSIYGANLPTTPYTTNADGRGPAWSNSLFEDNAEFGFGIRLAIDKLTDQATRITKQLARSLGQNLVADLLAVNQSDEQGIADARNFVEQIREKLKGIKDIEARRLETLLDYLVRKNVWLIGGDGWAYDIGFGGLDHVIANNRDVNILVLDTEVYSNTGGQQSKATPMGAAAKFAAAGKAIGKKDLGRIAMSYGHVYVAQVAMGAKMAQTVTAFREAEAHPGPSLIIAHTPCIAHGYDLRYGARQQDLAVKSGIWPLYRYDPKRVAEGKPPLQLDCKAPTVGVAEYMNTETRFRMVEKLDPERYQRLQKQAQLEAQQQFAVYEQLSKMIVPTSFPAKDEA